MSIKRQTLWNLAPTLVTAVVGFFSLPWFYKYLGTEMYAIQGYINSLATAFGFADLGLGVVVARFVSVALGRNDRTAIRAYWGTGNLVVLPALLLVTLAFIGLTAAYGPRWFNVPAEDKQLLRMCFAVNGLGLFLAYYGSYWLAISQAFLDFKFIGLIRAVVTLMQILPSMAIAFFKHNVFYILLWTTGISALQLAVLIWHARREYALGFCLGHATLARVREMAGYASKMILSLVVNSIFASVDLRLLGRLAPPDQFSPYVLASNVSQRLQSLSVSVMGPVLHNTARAAGGGGPAGDTAAAARIYNEMFGFLFGWYLLAAFWLGLWHPVLLDLYVGSKTALAVGPLLTPLVAACCLTAISNIANAQLISNRMGTTVVFSVVTGLLTVDAVCAGYALDGTAGAAWGFVASRVAGLGQDLYVIRMLKAGGWLAASTWRQFGGQTLMACVFALAYLTFPPFSRWLLVPAVLHGVLVAGWLLRAPLRKVLASSKSLGKYFPVLV